MSLQHTVIAGGSSGIGLASAQQLLALGHKVTITGRDEEKLTRARQTLTGDVHAVVMDGTDIQSVRNAFTALGTFGHLVLALGSGKGAGPFASVDLAEVRAGFEQKVFAHFATAQAALPFLSGQGSITFISAVSAHAALPGTAGLGAANAAVSALVPILAVELKPLRVNAVAPGVIETPWWDFLSAEQKVAAFAGYAAMTPVGRVGRADDVAAVVALLVSNSFMTGQTIICDGGINLTA